MPTMKDSGPRTLFLGMQNEMSFRAFIGLLKHDINICGVALAIAENQVCGFSNARTGFVAPASPSELPIVNRFVGDSILQTASALEIPLIPIIGNEMAGLRNAISTFQPDIACVACFPLRLPANILDSVEHGFINFHPSMLPFHRGPAPLFWIFRSANQEASGVTVHLVDEGLDTGDIVLQQEVEFATGISGFTADRMTGEIGGALLAKAAIGLWTGTNEPNPQPPGGNYDPWPVDSDFRIAISWNPRRAYNFMRGTAHWQRSYPIDVGEETIELTEAIAYRPENWTAKHVVGSNDIDIVFVRFDRGILEARRI
ncbi:MAG: formyltransferase family protein [Candidatus Promineifilaceae bacterium]